MNRRPPTNIAASIRARLLARSRQTGDDFNFMLSAMPGSGFSTVLAYPLTEAALSSRVRCCSPSGVVPSTAERAISTLPGMAAARAMP